jgi:hypothetical protein
MSGAVSNFTLYTFKMCAGSNVPILRKQRLGVGYSFGLLLGRQLVKFLSELSAIITYAFRRFISVPAGTVQINPSI